MFSILFIFFICLIWNKLLARISGKKKNSDIINITYVTKGGGSFQLREMKNKEFKACFRLT